MRCAVALLVLAVLLAGCGGHSAPGDAKFQKLDYTMATYETSTAQYNARYLESATRRYIALVREYAPQLGRREAKRRLVEKGDELGPYCLPCAGELYAEAKNY
jgi:hypothetical protein